MANIKQQIKRIKTNEKRRQLNAAFKSSMRTAIKAVDTAVAAKNKEEALTSYSIACKKLDKALAKGFVHKNFVSRQKSSIAKLINTI